MIEPIWQAVAQYTDADRMLQDVHDAFSLSRLCSYDAIILLANHIAARMERAGMEDVRLIEHPADGRTFHGGWAMPRAYDVAAARLTDVSAGESLADYAASPTSLMLYSTPTPAEGVAAEVVVADSHEEITAERCAGRFVLTRGIGVEYGLAAARVGAVGLVSDHRNLVPHVKEGRYLDRTNEWHNYTIPPWDLEGKGFGFAITPDQGRTLRDRIAAGETVRLQAVVDTRHYDGRLPVVSGILPGRLSDQIVLTGHFDEFGADDNCSQVAVILEAVRCIGEAAASGTLPPLERSIRVLLPMEVRGFNALIQSDEEIRYLRAGLNVDTVGTDQNAASASCSLAPTFAALPSFTDDLAAELLCRVQRSNPLFRWHRAPAETIDNIFGEPLIGAPISVIYHFSGTHHLALDTPDRLSPRMLVDMAALTATFAALLATGGLREALWLAELSAARREARIRAVADEALLSEFHGLERRLHAELEDAVKCVRSARWLASDVPYCPTADGIGELAARLVGPKRLEPRAAFDVHADQLVQRLEAAERDAADRVRERRALVGRAPADEHAQPASRCVPVKLFRGFLAFEDLTSEESHRLRELTGIRPSWGAPMWLQQALFLANGKRTAAEIGEMLRNRGSADIDTSMLERAFDFLAERGMVRVRPYLTRDDVLRAVEALGIDRGDNLVAHFSLSRFGYIEGGTDTVIEAVLDATGPAGTLLVPTFSWSWVGNPPYCRATTPSRVGAVTERFRVRAGAIRSDHPTHSLAALGPAAPDLLAGHDASMSPVDPAGPLGRLAAMGGKVLLLAPLAANTTLHLGEHAGGVPLPAFLCHYIDSGRRRVELEVPRCPWHGRFSAAYERLQAAGAVREAPLGDSTAYAMAGRAAIDAQTAVARETPERLLEPGCDCHACRALVDHCRTLGRPTT